MLAKRIIPTLLTRGRQLVKGRCFDSWRSVGLAAQAVRIHQQRGVDELALMDITATAEGRGPDLNLIEELTAKCFMPLAVAGGIRAVVDVRNLLSAGADKAIIGTAAHENPRLLSEIADKVGSQAICVAIDIKAGTVWTHSGTKDTGMDPLTYAALAEKNGAGELLLTSIERDGTMEGYDLALVAKIAYSVHIPVIAAGGCGTYQHMLEAIEAGADAVAAGAMFQFSDQTQRVRRNILQCTTWRCEHETIDDRDGCRAGRMCALQSPGGSVADFDREYYDCQRDTAPISDPWRRIAMEDRCLMSKGWRK
jgi:cyclase